MPDLRQDPLTGRWVIVAEDREGRPNEFRLSDRWATDPETCPFCPGHEAETTPEIVATGRPGGGAADTSGWRVRVFPNLYPALTPPDDRPGTEFGRVGGVDGELFATRPGHGRHEVVVYSPCHEDSLVTLTAEHLTEVLIVVRDRCRDLARVASHRYVLPFANHGPTAGATLAHPHLQLIALPEVPDVVRTKVRRGADYHKRTGRCLVCDLLAAEERAADRVISAGADWLVWAPWASRSPWEMMATSRRHTGDLRDLSDRELAAGAKVLSRALGALGGIFADPPLNLIIHSAPLAPDGRKGYNAGQRGSDPVTAGFHWHLEILPRLTRLAGFEVGTGFGINSVAPETAARRLREEGSDS